MLLTDGTRSIQFSNCRVTREVVNEGTSGRWMELTIEDRRWKWADSCFAIYGEYNRSGTPLDRQQNTKSLVELARLCLDALGERNYDVSALPNNVYPPVIWDAASPAVELDLLCQRYGYLVALQPTDTVEIVADGIGSLPSAGDPRAMDFRYQSEPPVIPGAFVVEGGRATIHHDLPLIPVVREPDSGSANYGKFVHIDDVSFAPAGGWGREDPFNFGTVLANDPQHHRLAKEQVWKFYQFAMPKGTSNIQLPSPPQESLIGFRSRKALTPTQRALLSDFFQIDDSTLHRLLPLNQVRRKPQLSGGYSELEIDPIIYGFYHSLNLANQNTTVQGFGSPSVISDCSVVLSSIFDYSRMAIDDPPSPRYQQLIVDKRDVKWIDWNNGRVLFNEPMYFLDSTDGFVPPPLRIRCSFPIRDPETMAAICPQFWYQPGSVNANDVAKLVKDSSYGLEYSSRDPSNSSFDNASVFLAWAQEIVKKEINRYAVSQGLSIPYNTFVFDKPIDGITKAIVWDKAENGAGITHIDYGMERPAYYLTLNERRLSRSQTYNITAALEDERKRKRGYGTIRIGGKTP